MGADYSVESATKYLNGHSDQIAGVVAASKEKIEHISSLAMYVGCFLSTDGCYMLQRGMRTFALRMARHNDSGVEVALGLQELPQVESVHYAGIDPTEGNTAKPMDGFEAYGGMICVRFKDNVSVEALMDNLQLVANVPSLGGTETSACLPLHTTHKWTSAEVCAKQGVDAQVLRISVGLEKPADLVEDFKSALSVL